MKQKNPTVSFIIRTKNEQKFIGKVLKYIFAQTYKDIEVIIVDSESTDETLNIIKNFPVKVIKIKQKDFSYSYSLNLGIKNSKGKYICIISGHSIPITDNWLEKGLSNFKNKKVAGVTGVCIVINPLGYISRKIGFLVSFLSLYILYRRTEDLFFINNTNSIIRKDLWKEYPFNEKLKECEDLDWATEMKARGYKLVRDPAFSVFHSHIFLKGKPRYITRFLRWWKIGREIKNKKRPSTPHSRISTN